MKPRAALHEVPGVILVGLKNVFHVHHRFLDGNEEWSKDRPEFPGGYFGRKIGIIGISRISRLLIGLLRNFDFEISVCDDHLTPDDARKLGVTKETLEPLMSTSDVVTLHHADIPEHWNTINRSNLRLMKDGAVFINTSRGRLVNEVDLVQVLETGRITAFLDVTHPEPPQDRMIAPT